MRALLQNALLDQQLQLAVHDLTGKAQLARHLGLIELDVVLIIEPRDDAPEHPVGAQREVLVHRQALKRLCLPDHYEPSEIRLLPRHEDQYAVPHLACLVVHLEQVGHFGPRPLFAHLLALFDRTPPM
ncbi:hypothetical protein RirG_011300 [Rhizophagus irregularis DAOM 197198w]|uniref:Uncharacterized protein n=1 Tax=Rhizophagus irregularis (strain DAOM 197198w) TaxID=1432141 RepID=A0A015KAN9_RHIIW|nr:hypothetical protein RirG_011300 [Rhizophagus irregularis DAOM 197198w]